MTAIMATTQVVHPSLMMSELQDMRTSIFSAVCVNKWLLSAGKRQHSVSFVYRSYHLPMPDPSPSTLTV